MELKGKHILITAGPTREYIDPVRFISNDSSGAMGIALARVAKKMGAKVTLICGPVNPPRPPFGKGGRARVSPLCKGGRGGILNVISAREMFEAVKKHYKSADIIICAAAVSDFRPERYSSRKIKKNVVAKLALPKCVGEGFHPLPKFWEPAEGLPYRSGRASSATTVLKLIPNPDILAWLGSHKKKRQCLIGFALETENVVKNAMKKLESKRCDIIVANHASAIGAQRTSATIISKGGAKRAFANRTKQFIACEILKLGENS